MKKLFTSVLVTISIFANAQTGWIPQTSGIAVSLKATDFVGNTTGFTVGLSSTFLKTMNGGGTWTNIPTGITAQDFLAVDFIDINTGWIVGANGLIIKTTDGGTTWTQQTSNTVNTIYSVHFIDANTGFTCGATGEILKTIDGGIIWTLQTSGSSATLLSINFFDVNIGWCTGIVGTVLKTTDGGTTWTAQVSSGTAQLDNITSINSTTAYICGSGGTILKTINGGTTWTNISFGSNYELRGLYFADVNNGFAVGDMGTIARTKNGGTTWTTQTSGTIDSLFSVDFVGGNGWTVGNNGVILNTTSFGEDCSTFAITPSSSSPACGGGSDGWASVASSGGTTPYSYLWGNSQTTSSIYSLIGGIYSVTTNDANNCKKVNNITVADTVSVITFTPTITNETCSTSNGSVISHPSGGILNANISTYMYSWSNGATTENITGISAGIYFLTIIDANYCSNTGMIAAARAPLTNVTITNTIPPSFSMNIGHETKPALCDGSASLNMLAGTAPYNYNYSTGVTTSTLSNLCPGPYSVTVTDANSCTGTGAFTVDSAIYVTPVVAAPTCGCNGTVKANATGPSFISGATTTYTYLWSNSSTNQTATGICGGAVAVTVSASTGISTVLPITVVNNALAVTVSPTDISCNGGSNGSASVAVTGGFSPYNYAWSNSTFSNTATGLTPKIYNVTITDMAQCNVISSATIAEPTAIVITNNRVNVSCNGLSDGSLTINPTGGTSPYTYNWSFSGNTTATQTGLWAGSFSTFITDANGCTRNPGAIISEPSVFLTTVSATNVSCNGGSNGTATVSVSGGTTPYTYRWNNGITQTTGTATGLPNGNYIATVTDANGCTTINTLLIDQPLQILVNKTVLSVNCFGLNNGEIATSTSGGTSPYSYLWSNNSTNTSITGLNAANYSVTITDANLCSITFIETITEPAVLSAINNVVDISCFGNADGSITPSITGGTSSYNYLWNNGSTAASLSNLNSGTYVLTVTDANSCSNTASSTITDPTPLSASISSSNTLCNGDANGSVSYTGTGGTPPYTYSWSIGNTNNTVTGVMAGSYSVTLSDANNCSVNNIATVAEPNILSTSLNGVSSNCGNTDGSITTNTNGGTSPYNYIWNNGATTPSINNLSANPYAITITDNNGCTINAAVNISDNQGPTISILGTTDANCGGADGGANVSISGGTTPFSYLWSNNDTLLNLSNIIPGTYTLQVTDANNCIGMTSAIINNLGNVAPSISGHITNAVSGFTMNNGQVTLYSSQGNVQMDSITTVLTNGSGNYTFPSVLPIGNYLILARPDTLQFPNATPTYFGFTEKWIEATTISVVCDSNYNVDFQVIDLTPMSGTSSISGFINQQGSNKNGQAGGPIPGVNVSLEQIPGGIVANTQTGDNGFYSFNNVPVSDSSYTIYVDIPGLIMDSSYTIHVNSDTTMTNLDFLVGNSIFIENTTGVESFTIGNSVKATIYPNPFSNNTSLSYELIKESTVSYEIYNVFGKLIYASTKVKQPKGKYKQTLSIKSNSTGVYFINISIGAEFKTIKVVKM